MPMINANVMRAVGEALVSHHVTPRPDEHVADALARALDLSDAQVHQWLTALSEGCTVEEANHRIGLTDHRNEALGIAIARAIGTALGKLSR